MFSTQDQLEKRMGRFGTPRFNYLQKLVTEFQDTADTANKEQLMANLANFAYDPINYEALRQLNVLDLFMDHLEEENPRLVEFALGGLCNCVVDWKNAQLIMENGGIPNIIKCLSSSHEETVLSAIALLFYLIAPHTKKDIAAPPVMAALQRYAASANLRLRNAAGAFLHQVSTLPPQ